ncbi:hypothetical protein SAMN06265337_1538 [Hymenobacter gelipurpurascens]|uniref:Uncharacterized protein n=1 Tax=Hymenobacter gelipurpurascens TaxID=89968 RepID=A0A212TK56_9BACT|nr:hypothetical protein [Hymenobacter gelipurpurascens]SNC66221.1 hypothetical protein SAMN06265337_1538 [Hymenobacter gelipurpurascens]
MKKLFYIVGCLVVLSSSPVLAVAEDPAVVVVRIYESRVTVEVTVVRGTGQPEFYKFGSGSRQKDLVAAATGYQEVIAKLYAQGYILQESLEGIQGESSNLHTLIFVKAPSRD